MDELTTDPRIQSLWQEVIARIQVSFQPSDDEYWGTSAKNGRAIIYTHKAAHPIECLAHELLHLKVQLDGYRCLRWMIWPSFDKNSVFAGHLLTMLDNELQHHRTFPLYQAMGFDPKAFYADADKEVIRQLDKARDSNDDFRQPFLDYFSLIAPGGVLSDAQKLSYSNNLRRLGGGRYSARFDEIDQILGDWCQTVGYDAESIVRRLIHLFQKPTKAWIGYESGADPNFPKGGFFVDDQFSTLS